jgi:hypothetical protein
MGPLPNCIHLFIPGVGYKVNGELEPCALGSAYKLINCCIDTLLERVLYELEPIGMLTSSGIV